ncbi:MAG: UDP-N-acetylmuramoyl-tripeptide--D-alanyl-D-alanine ligase [Tannerella sp.]|jgi:UDP-N-acetylmuramoyl-tripeptide--D-alanyl-D-alanine ligase|nr:UDP-N-acetylmuramoyl-tripeptide--D-alanyl-D-alanine ligase [Tannerella sp.]
MTIPELYELYLQHPAVTTDSRKCRPGAIFFALQGESFDGNSYAPAALQAGCAYAVIDRPEVKTDDRMILTDDVLTTLQELAGHHRQTLGLTVIGITGTNGKTTTKELLAATLATKYRLLSTSGNLNNHIGVPLTLLGLTHEHDMAVVEMGANHPGEIEALARIARPDYGLITNVGCAHLEGFGSPEGVLRTKGELYDYLRLTHGKVFIHKENTALQSIVRELEQITYGERDGADVSGRMIDCRPFLRLQWTHKGVDYTLSTRLVGDYNLPNVLAAITAGCYFGVPPGEINRAIAAYEPANNRSQWKTTASNELIIDAYNANPSSMKAALLNFAALPVRPKAVILGDMLELGVGAPAFHAEVVTQLRSAGFEQVFLCGKQYTAAGSRFYPCFPDVEALNDYLSGHPLRRHHVLLKGSHGIHLEKVIDRL